MWPRDSFLLLPGREWLLPRTANAGAEPHPTSAHQSGFFDVLILAKDKHSGNPPSYREVP